MGLGGHLGSVLWSWRCDTVLAGYYEMVVLMLDMGRRLDVDSHSGDVGCRCDLVVWVSSARDLGRGC
jgi:hypothetical protein